MRKLTRDDYDRAFEMWPTNLRGAALNTHVDPHWLRDGSDDFWWRRDTREGYCFFLTHAETGESAPLFDHDALAAKLSDITGQQHNADSLQINMQSYDSTTGQLTFAMGGKVYVTSRLVSSLDEIPPRKMPPGLLSPDGCHDLFVKDHNLWIRQANGNDERPLTHDGVRYNAYGSMPDHDRMAIARSRGPVLLPPIGCYWSPDNQQILVFRCDERRVKDYPFLESVPWNGATRPLVHQVKMPFPGDADRPVFSYYLVSADGSETIEITLDGTSPGFEPYLVECGISHWTADGRTLYLLAGTSDRKLAGILAIDRQTGQSRTVYQEQEASFFDFNAFDYHRPNVWFLSDDRRAVWYSQRDGFGHLYLVDLVTGETIRQITGGNWPVFDLLSVDVERNFVLFSAAARDTTENPYHRHLHRAALVGSAVNEGLVQLTRSGFDHAIAGNPLHLMAMLTGNLHKSCLSPSGAYFEDNQSTTSIPTETFVARIDGLGEHRINMADISSLQTLGWTAPQSFEMQFDDIAEPICGIIYLPRGFAKDKALPIVERIYAGPQAIAQPRSFDESLHGNFVYASHTLAEFGFAVVIFDTPGTPYRSKAWHDAGYGTRDRLNVATHARVLQALAAQDDWLDGTRFGVSGHSWGGHAAAMALLLQPDTYSVGVSSAGLYDPQVFFLDASEKALGSPVYADGSSIRTGNADKASNYEIMSPSAYAAELKGHLLLAIGDLDENVAPASLFQFVDRLIKARKDVDLLLIPGANHGIFANPYFQKRKIDYFIRYLAGDEPLMHYTPDVQAGQRMLI